ncbi:MAG: hypothetical protein IJ763_07785 [Lachnospiraceae bacterium]|nr:hypothetical protein [Lachnospiraceae bacterium]
MKKNHFKPDEDINAENPIKLKPDADIADKTESLKEGKTEKIKHMTFENNLEMSELSFRERHEARKAQRKAIIKDMSSKEKISYFFYYNKWKIIFSLIVIIYASAAIATIIRNTRPYALSYAIVNHNFSEVLSDEPIRDYLKYYNMDKGYQVNSSTNIHLNLKEYLNGNAAENDSTSYDSFPLLCSENYYDIIISDKNGIDFCVESYIAQPVEDVLSSDIIEEITMKYPDIIHSVKEENGESTNIYIDISDTDFAKNLNLSYNKVYICFPGKSSQNVKNAEKAMKFILSLDYNIN